jgi:PAS domain-containing protein
MIMMDPVDSMLDREVAAARTALRRRSQGRKGPSGTPTGAALWIWDLADGRLEWEEGLQALFGHAEATTDAAWREDHIHPQDRSRVKVSLQRATIADHGALWSARYRFRRSDGSYVAVTERAYVVSDDAGPRKVLGAIRPSSARPARRVVKPRRPARDQSTALRGCGDPSPPGASSRSSG